MTTSECYKSKTCQEKYCIEKEASNDGRCSTEQPDSTDKQETGNRRIHRI